VQNLRSVNRKAEKTIEIIHLQREQKFVMLLSCDDNAVLKKIYRKQDFLGNCIQAVNRDNVTLIPLEYLKITIQKSIAHCIFWFIKLQNCYVKNAFGMFIKKIV